jgi:hypothetical protein
MVNLFLSVKKHPMKNKWYATDIAFFFYGTIVGLIISGIDSSCNFSLNNISVFETILSGFFGFIAFQIRQNQCLRSYMDAWFKNLRRISEDPYREYERDTIIKFLKIIITAQTVYSVDRNNPDTWFLNDNYIAFLCLEEALITRNDLQGHRMFIWKEESYYQSRYQQLLLLNVYAGINTYIVPLEFLQRKKTEFIEFLDSKQLKLKQQMDQHGYFKNEWINALLNNSDGEEFLLCEQDGNIVDGIGKVKTDSVQERSLEPCERKVYKLFFDWIRSAKDNGKEIALLEQISPDPDFPTNWRNQIDNKIKTLRGV